MNRTKIEWCDYTWNPIKGLCPVSCWYCYARKIYKRFKLNPEVRLDKKELNCKMPQKASKIFVGSTIDLFYKSINTQWVDKIIEKTKQYPQHTFMFLTKYPEHYSNFYFPDNCWLGQTITSDNDYTYLPSRTTNNVFISIEPLLSEIKHQFHFYSWIIVGGLTPKPVHKREWVENIIKEARLKNVPIFLKNNLHWHEKIQEYPEEIK